MTSWFVQTWATVRAGPSRAPTKRDAHTCRAATPSVDGFVPVMDRPYAAGGISDDTVLPLRSPIFLSACVRALDGSPVGGYSDHTVLLLRWQIFRIGFGQVCRWWYQ